MSDAPSQPLTLSEAEELLRDAVRRVCVGPHMSKDLERAETASLITAILAYQEHPDPVQIGLLLVGLRVKRETPEETPAS